MSCETELDVFLGNCGWNRGENLRLRDFSCAFSFEGTKLHHLVLVPVFIFALVMGFLITKSARELMIAYTGVHVLSYALAYPLRENLYVITSRDIKFKVKAWIDSIGAKNAKLSGQGVNKFLVDIGAKYGINAFNHWTAAIFVVIIAVWIFVAVLLGKKYHSSVQKGEIIE